MKRELEASLTAAKAEEEGKVANMIRTSKQHTT